MTRCSIWWLLTYAMALSGAAHAAEGTRGFERCSAFEQFADCTRAVCDTSFECTCALTNNVASGVSVPPGCMPPVGATVQSHYAPVATTGLCRSQTTTWAQCLGVTCTITPGGVKCPCTQANAQSSGGGPYVIVTSNPVYMRQCTDGTIYSSATFDVQVKSISEALRFRPPTVLWTE